MPASASAWRRGGRHAAVRDRRVVRALLAPQAFTPAHDSFWAGLRAGFGQALIIAMYDYAGYGPSSAIGDEVRRTGAHAAALDRDLDPAGRGAVHADADRRARRDPVADDRAACGRNARRRGTRRLAVVEQRFGAGAAVAVTVLILITAFASAYGNLLGFSRVPYAAARRRHLPQTVRARPRARCASPTSPSSRSGCSRCPRACSRSTR